MADVRRRVLERATARGDEDAALQLLGDHLRTGSGLPRERLELAAFLLQPAGLDLVARPLGALPSNVFRKGAEVPLETVQRDGRGQLEARLFCIDGGLDAGRLVVLGYLGSRSSPWYSDMLWEVGQLGIRRLLLDLSQAAGINSGGMGSIFQLNQDLEQRGGALVLLLQARIREVVDMLGLNQFFSLPDSEADGLRLLLEGSVSPLAMDGDAWLGRLLRWGVSVPLRGALAVGRRLLEDAPDDLAARSALQAAEAWQLEPSASKATAAAAAAEVAAGEARQRLPKQGAHLWWAYRAAHLAGRGIWPRHAPEALPVQLAQVRSALLAWALAIAS